jgi:holo-[acyl-carrier protein] synthase
VAGRHHVEPLEGVGLVAGAEFVEKFGGIGEFGGEVGGDFGADFVAATADRGADRGEEIFRVGFEFHLHLADGFDNDAGEGAAPAGVDGGDDAFFRIDYQHRGAIGRAHAEEQSLVVCGQCVAFGLLAWIRVDDPHDVGMNLVERHEIQIAGADCGLESLSVFVDVLALIPFHGSEIENFFAVDFADAAGAGAESVDEPGQLVERGGLDDGDAAVGAFGPVFRRRSFTVTSRARLPFRRAGLCRLRFEFRLAVGFAAARRCFRGGHNPVSIIAVGHDIGIGAAALSEEPLIIGLGVDIAEVGRIQAAIERHGETILRRLYTPAEREYCERFKNKYERFAGRFAAKEAAMKALGTGWSRGVRWVDVEVVRQKGGRPTVKLHGEAGKISERLGVKNISLSITHTSEQAFAQVIFES